MPSILKTLLNQSLRHAHVHQLYIGQRWILSIVSDETGKQRAGLAMSPADEHLRAHPQFVVGLNHPRRQNAVAVAHLSLSHHPLEAAIGMATLNALLFPNEGLLQQIDAGDWLVTYGSGCRMAFVGRFPFIEEEITPIAKQVWTFEQDPRVGEYGPEAMPELLPRAEIVAITSSTFANHTIDAILSYVSKEAKVVLLGPTTPLSSMLFDFGIDLLCGVQVEDMEALCQDVAAGTRFRYMRGLRRVSLSALE